MIIVPAILCGGAGSRLWPVSRELHPKPFIRLHDGESLLQKAFIRAASIPGVTEILTVTNQDLFFKTQDDYQAINHKHLPTSYILEPCGRNTAACMAIASLYVQKLYGDTAILLPLAADHLIQDEIAFNEAVSRAIELALRDKIVTFGIHPLKPETGYGYIQIDQASAYVQHEDTIGYNVQKFIEKPDLETANHYLQEGGYYWNSGLFCFKASLALAKMQTYCPDILSAAKTSFENTSIEKTKSWSQCRLDEKTFAQIPDNSFDYAVLEPMSVSETEKQALTVVPCDIGWTDIGSWEAFSDLSSPDVNGNRALGQALFHNAVDCYIHSPSRLASAVGVKNLIIIDTPDALLVVDKNSAQEVKHIYKKLKENNHEAHKIHRTVHRPWGTYTVLEDSDRYKIKRIEVNAGASLSLQMHHHRSEHWIVVSGAALVTNDEKEFLLSTNQSTYIQAGHKHRLKNPGVVKLVMIEVQSGEYLGEDDIVRFQDFYGRVQADLTPA